MGNAFDSANYPTTEPDTLVAGDRWAWKRTDLGADYPPASYALKYVLRQHETGAEIEISAVGSGLDYVVEVLSVTTAAHPPGRYTWTAFIIRTIDNQRVRVGTGTLTIAPDRDTDSADPRSHSRKVLDAITAVMENRATVDQQEYSIAGRSLKRMSIADLLLLKDRYQIEVNREEAAEKLAAGTGNNPRRIGVRLSRV